jgi:signal transduction histidine kinase
MASRRRTPPLRSVLFDLAVVGSLLLVAPASGNRRNGWVILIGLVMVGSLLARRAYPLTVMVGVSLLGLAQVVFFPPEYDPQFYDLAVLVALYSVLKYGKRLWYGFAAAVPVGTGVVLEVNRHIPGRAPGTNLAWIYLESSAFLGGICVAVWLTGYVVRTRRIYVTGLEERALTAERERDHLARIAVAEERSTIARELHDVVAHSLAVMIVQADGASYALDDEPDQARLAIKQVAVTGREALSDMRRLVGVLRGARADESGEDTDRRRIGLDQLDGLIERACSAGVAATLTSTGDRPAELPAAVELTVFRIAQEAVTNVLRHAGTGAAVQLRLVYGPEEISISVLDDGGGQLAGQSLTSPAATEVVRLGHGLVGMRERVAVLGGRFEAGPLLGRGWKVEASVRWT